MALGNVRAIMGGLPPTMPAQAIVTMLAVSSPVLTATSSAGIGNRSVVRSSCSSPWYNLLAFNEPRHGANPWCGPDHTIPAAGRDSLTERTGCSYTPALLGGVFSLPTGSLGVILDDLGHLS